MRFVRQRCSSGAAAARTRTGSRSGHVNRSTIMHRNRRSAASRFRLEFEFLPQHSAHAARMASGRRRNERADPRGNDPPAKESRQGGGARLGLFRGRARAGRLGRVLLLLREVDGLSLEDVEERLRRLEDFHVRGLRLLDRLVVLVPRHDAPRERLVDFRQPVRQDAARGSRVERRVERRAGGGRAAPGGRRGGPARARRRAANRKRRGRSPEILLDLRLLLLLLQDRRVHLRRGGASDRGARGGGGARAAAADRRRQNDGRARRRVGRRRRTASRFSRRSSMHLTSSLL